MPNSSRAQTKPPESQAEYNECGTDLLSAWWQGPHEKKDQHPKHEADYSLPGDSSKGTWSRQAVASWAWQPVFPVAVYFRVLKMLLLMTNILHPAHDFSSGSLNIQGENIYVLTLPDLIFSGWVKVAPQNTGTSASGWAAPPPNVAQASGSGDAVQLTQVSCCPFSQAGWVIYLPIPNKHALAGVTGPEFLCMPITYRDSIFRGPCAWARRAGKVDSIVTKVCG